MTTTERRTRMNRATRRKASSPNSRGEAGFTLLELLVVLVILVLVASIVGPQVMGYLGSSQVKTASVQIKSLETAVELFRLDTGRYPTSAEGLEALVKPPGGITDWGGP